MIFRIRRSSLLLPWLLAAACCLVMTAQGHAQRITGVNVHARTLLHPDGTKTESTKDPVKLEQTEVTFDSRGVKIAEKVFRLNQNGDPIEGIIFDGAKNVVARVYFYFDDLGRVVQERCVNTRNEVFRYVIREYDRNGQAKPPKAVDTAVKAPHMSAATLDFTNMPALPPKDGSPQGQVPQQPGQFQPTAPQRTQPPPAEEKKKRGFRLPWQKK